MRRLPTARRFQYSARSLLGLVTAVAIALGCWCDWYTAALRVRYGAPVAAASIDVDGFNDWSLNLSIEGIRVRTEKWPTFQATENARSSAAVSGFSVTREERTQLRLKRAWRTGDADSPFLVELGGMLVQTRKMAVAAATDEGR